MEPWCQSMAKEENRNAAILCGFNLTTRDPDPKLRHRETLVSKAVFNENPQNKAIILDFFVKPILKMAGNKLEQNPCFVNVTFLNLCQFLN